MSINYTWMEETVTTNTVKPASMVSSQVKIKKKKTNEV